MASALVFYYTEEGEKEALLFCAICSPGMRPRLVKGRVPSDVQTKGHAISVEMSAVLQWQTTSLLWLSLMGSSARCATESRIEESMIERPMSICMQRTVQHAPNISNQAERSPGEDRHT